MAANQTLLADLRELIKGYADRWRREKTGDATIAELTVMACVMSDEPLSVPDVYGWVSRHSIECGDRDLSAWLSFVDLRALDWRAPLRVFREQGHETWQSPIPRANVYLRGRLFQHATTASRTPFRIMDLPAEIRVSIFEFALALPPSGVWYDFQTTSTPTGAPSRGTKAWIAGRDGSRTLYYPSVWRTDRDSTWHDPKFLFEVDLKVHLSLFRVSKSVYKEAFPCYYLQNVFFLPNDWAAIKLFEQFSMAQLSHLSNIVWRCSKNQPPSQTLAQHLATLPRLRTLVVDLPPFGQERMPLSDLMQVTMIKGLQDVQFFGSTVEHEEFLRSKMLEQKEESGHVTEYGGGTDAMWLFN